MVVWVAAGDDADDDDDDGNNDFLICLASLANITVRQSRALAEPPGL